MTAKERYAAGWAYIPVPARSKNPGRRNWQHEHGDSRHPVEAIRDHLNAGGNVGVLLGEASAGLVDVDLDSPETIRLADRFLPETGIVFGRVSKPRSHRFYIAHVNTSKFRDPLAKKGDPMGMLVELRSTGTQTLVPPSTNPSGERATYDADGEPAEVDGAVLLRAVAQLATAALLARYWPAEGARHDAALALSGFLLRGGLEDATTSRIIAAAAEVAGDSEWRDRARAVRDTAATLRRGGQATGGRTASEMLGVRLVTTIGDWLELGQAKRSTDTCGETDETTAGRLRSSRSSMSYPAPLAPEAFHGLAGDIVRTIEPHSEADPAALLIQVLVAFGNIVGREPHFYAEADRHGTNLFAALVGETAKGRKGTSWGQVRRLTSETDDTWPGARRIPSGLSSGPGLIWAVRDPIEQMRKGTVTETDPGISDKRLLVHEPELASTLRVLAREGNTLSAVARQAWDGVDLQTMVKNEPGVSTKPHISIVGHITRDELRRYLDRTEVANGFANRFLWVCVRRSKELPHGGNLDDADLYNLRRELKNAVANAQAVARLTRDSEANAVWERIYSPLSAGHAGMFGAVVARAEPQVMRLALIYALLDEASAICRPHLLAALAVWDYCEASARYIFGDALGNPVADALLHALRVAGTQGMTRTQIRDFFKKNRTASEIEGALATLQERGLAHGTVRRDTGGADAEVWFSGTTGTTETTEGGRTVEDRSFQSYLELGKSVPPPGNTHSSRDATLGTENGPELDPTGTELL